MAIFELKGTYRVPLIDLQQGRRFDDVGLEELRRLPDFGIPGCYVFWMEFPNGEKPIYVGKTQKQDLGSRAFGADNLLRVQNYINDKAKRFPLHIFLIGQKKAPGAPSISSIDTIELWLIFHARQKNSELVNQRRVTHNILIPHNIVIEYILNSSPLGPPPAIVRQFRKMMGL